MTREPTPDACRSPHADRTLAPMASRRDPSWLVAACLVVACGTAAPPKAEDRPPAEVSAIPASRLPPHQQHFVGRAAPSWGELDWLDDPLSDADIRGHVVLVRFFTDTCGFCRASAPALRELNDEFADLGVKIVGMYHPKPRGRPVSRDAIEGFAREHGWTFPVGIDADWAVMDAFWPPGEARRHTSFSMLIDRAGVVRYVHPGPEFHSGGPADHEQCRSDFSDIRAGILALLAESV